jgi:DUF4097 and DUF4098 domain-containing protein YvlB
LFSGIFPSEAQTQHSSTFERRLEVTAGGVFQLTNVSGDITVTGTSGRFVRISGVKRVQVANAAGAAALLEFTVIEVETRSDSVGIRTRQPSVEEMQRAGNLERIPVSVTYSVEVPRDVRVNLRTTSGSIRVSGIEQDVNLETASGSITTDSIGGSVSAGSVRGDITISGTGRGVDSNTVSGDIVLTGVDDRIRATCVSGDITIRGGNLTEVWANNTGGDIHCEGAVGSGARYQLTSHSGDIEFVAVEGGGFRVSLSTVSGSISAPLELTLTGTRTSRRSLTGVYRRSEASVELTTFSGNITLLTVPVPDRNEK